MTRVGSAGEDTWCMGCRRVISSTTLGFFFKTSEAGIEQCSVGGLPGYKGPGAEAKCYTYQPGNEEQEKRAQEKARASAYMHSRESHVRKMAIAFFQGPTADAVIDGTVTKDPDGVTVQPLSDQNQIFGLASKNDDWQFGFLGRSICSACGAEHEDGNCPLQQM